MSNNILYQITKKDCCDKCYQGTIMLIPCSESIRRDTVEAGGEIWTKFCSTHPPPQDYYEFFICKHTLHKPLGHCILFCCMISGKSLPLWKHTIVKVVSLQLF